jgi:hypothetical protein
MKRGLLPAVLLVLALRAEAFDRVTIHTGLLMMVNGIEDGAPSALVPPLGAWVPVQLPLPRVARLSWEAGLMLVGLTYRLEDGRGVPVEVEAANTFWVAGLGLDLRALYMFPVADGLTMGPTGGLMVFLRVPVIPYDDAGGDWSELAAFFAVRSLFPEIGAALRWQVLDTVALALQLRLLYPLHDLWDSATPSLLHEVTAGVLAGLELRL